MLHEKIKMASSLVATLIKLGKSAILVRTLGVKYGQYRHTQERKATRNVLMKCLVCEDSGWVCETIPISPGKARTHAPAAEPVHLALAATPPPPTKPPGCRSFEPDGE